MEGVVRGVGKQIILRVQGRGPGSVWTPSDFLDLGTRSAVHQALKRLLEKGVLQRVDRGVYSYPKLSPRIGPLSHSPDEVARAVAKATGSRIQMTGAAAANALGLSTQVPSKSVYLTDGPSRTVKLGRHTVHLKHVPAGDLMGFGTRAGLVFQALLYLGPGGVDTRTARRLAAQLNENDRKQLMQAKTHCPEWLQVIVERLADLE
jgi:hypothetical protein